MSTRPPLAQPLTLDFNVVAVRNASRALTLLGAASATELVKLRSDLAALSAQVAAGSAVPAHSHDLPAHSHLTLGSVVTVSEATRCAGVNASAPSAALEVRQPDGATAVLKVAASDGTARLVVDSAGRVGIGPTGTLAVPATVKNSASSGATLRVDGPVSGGYATSGVIEALSNGVLQGSFDGANISDRYGLFNFFGSPSATRFGELNFLDRTVGGDRRVCVCYVNAVGQRRGDFGLVTFNGSGFVYGLTVNSWGQVIGGGSTAATGSCFLEAANGFFHQTGELGFFGAGPTTQQSVTTADLAFTCPTPTTPDYDFTATSGGYGFASEDEFNSCMAVIGAMQSRINEVISALQAYGLLA